jgi:MATE family multidrug resistance protein
MLDLSETDGVASWASELRSTFTLGVPLALAEVGNQLWALVDLLVIGRTSANEVAGTSVGASLFALPLVLGIGAVSALDSIISKSLGAGDRDRAEGALRAGLQSSVVAGLAFALLSLLLWQALFLTGIAPSSQRAALLYLAGRAPSAITVLGFAALRAWLQANGSGRGLLPSVVGAIALNAAFDVLLVVQLGWGTFGIGLASTLASVIQFVWVARLAPPTILRSRFVPWADLRARVIAGLPYGLQRLAEVAGIISMGLLAGHFGPEIQSAHYLAMQVVGAGFTTAMGMSYATAVRVSRMVGGGKETHAQRAAVAGLAVTGGLMSLLVTAMLLMPDRIADSLTNSRSISAHVSVLLRPAAVLLLFDAFQIVCVGALRGAEGGALAFRISVGTFWCIGMPVALTLAFLTPAGVRGLWWGMIAAFVCGCSLMLVQIASRIRRAVAAPMCGGPDERA